MLSIPSSLGSARLEFLFLKGGVCFPGNIARVKMNCRAELIPEHFGFLVPRDQKIRGGVTILTRIMAPGVLEKAQWLLQNSSRALASLLGS